MLRDCGPSSFSDNKSNCGRRNPVLLRQCRVRSIAFGSLLANALDNRFVKFCSAVSDSVVRCSMFFAVRVITFLVCPPQVFDAVIRWVPVSMATLVAFGTFPHESKQNCTMDLNCFWTIPSNTKPCDFVPVAVSARFDFLVRVPDYFDTALFAITDRDVSRPQSSVRTGLIAIKSGDVTVFDAFLHCSSRKYLDATLYRYGGFVVQNKRVLNGKVV